MADGEGSAHGLLALAPALALLANSLLAHLGYTSANLPAPHPTPSSPLCSVATTRSGMIVHASGQIHQIRGDATVG